MIFDEGYTMPFIITAFILSGMGLIMSFISIITGLPVLAIGIILFFGKTGTIIQLNEKKIGRFRSLFGNRVIISSADLQRYDGVLIEYSRDAMRLNSRGTSTTVRTKYYTLHLLAGKKKKRMFHDYPSHDWAMDVSNTLKEEFGYEVSDMVANLRKRARKRRRRERY